MTQHSDILSDILNNIFTRLFAPAPPATVAPAHGADKWQPLIEETKHLEAALEQLRQRTATLRAATSPAQRSTQRSPAEEPQALEAVHNQAAAEILALHAHLQTHLTLEELQHGQALGAGFSSGRAGITADIRYTFGTPLSRFKRRPMPDAMPP